MYKVFVSYCYSIDVDKLWVDFLDSVIVFRYFLLYWFYVFVFSNIVINNWYNVFIYDWNGDGNWFFIYLYGNWIVLLDNFGMIVIVYIVFKSYFYFYYLIYNCIWILFVKSLFFCLIFCYNLFDIGNYVLFCV